MLVCCEPNIMRGKLVHGNFISLCKTDLRKFIIANCYDMLTICVAE
jgi:hypothetical protein